MCWYTKHATVKIPQSSLTRLLDHPNSSLILSQPLNTPAHPRRERRSSELFGRSALPRNPYGQNEETRANARHKCEPDATIVYTIHYIHYYTMPVYRRRRRRHSVPFSSFAFFLVYLSYCLFARNPLRLLLARFSFFFFLILLIRIFIIIFYFIYIASWEDYASDLIHPWAQLNVTSIQQPNFRLMSLFQFICFVTCDFRTT